MNTFKRYVGGIIERTWVIRRGWGWEGGGKNDIQFSDLSNWGEGAATSAQQQQQKYERFSKRKKTSVCGILTGRCPNKNV